MESISISYDNLRRLILEAVAFGSVLFDAETSRGGRGKQWLGGRVGGEKSMVNPWKRLKEVGKPWEIF